MKLIAQRIKETIDKNKATQIELAKAIDVNPKQIQRWKTGVAKRRKAETARNGEKSHPELNKI